MIQSQYIREYPGATAEAQENSLYLHIKQYSPLDQPESLAGAATIIAAHANGFPKVFLIRLLRKSESTKLC